MKAPTLPTLTALPLTAGAAALTRVAVGIVHNAQGQLLYAQRPAGKPYAGWWEFPGGKLEAGEALEDALVRELKEERGITVHDCHTWLTQRFLYPHAHVSLQFCHVRHFSGEPQSLEGQAFAWGTAAQPPLPFLPAALSVLKMLQLPQQLHFTHVERTGFEVWHSALNCMISGVTIVHEPESSESVAQQVLAACLKWKNAAPSQRTVLVSSIHPQAWWGLADGVHLREDDLLKLIARPSYEWVSADVQDRTALQAAVRVGCDFTTVGPVRDFARQAGLGWAALGVLLADSEVAAYAHGGLTEHDLPFAFAAGAAGVAL